MNSNSTSETYVYEIYDKDGNSYLSAEEPTTELRYECPICKGGRVLHTNNGNYFRFWRCNGNGYLISNSGK